MEVLVINGSPKGKGNTFKVIECLEKSMKSIDEKINFTYINLKEINLKMCRGCGVCFKRGEDKCPLKDDKYIIEEKIDISDVVVFATPVYVMNMSGIFKNFIDRFAYVNHRPRFYNKKGKTSAKSKFL